MGFFVDSLIGLVLVGLLVGVLLIRRKQRLVVNSLIGLLLVGVLAGILLYRHNQQRRDEQHRVVQEAMGLLRDQVAYHGALQVNQASDASFPPVISPLWFGSGLPMNVMVPGWHPWLDVAPKGDLEQEPPDPVITNPRQAGLWYNPNLGLVRARVQDQGTDSATLQLYNRLNSTDLDRLATSDNPQRQPLPLFSVLDQVQQVQAPTSDKPVPSKTDDGTAPVKGDGDPLVVTPVARPGL